MNRPAVLESSGQAPAKVNLTGVTKRYATKTGVVRALEPLDLRIVGGEFVAVLGPSGCGKSTMLLMIAGLLRPSEGQIAIDGSQIAQPYTDIGIVFQDHLLLDFRNAEENVLLQARIRGMPLGAARDRTSDLLAALGLNGLGKRYPRQLSGGQRQRVSIARALLHNPSLLLMDEPFGALDALTRTQVRVDLEKLWLEQKNTVVFVTHSIEEAVSLADRVIVMSPGPGRIVDDLRIEAPRPRPLDGSANRNLAAYVDRIYGRFREMGVLSTGDA